MHQRTHKSSSSNLSRQEKGSQFFRHTAIVQAKQNSSTPPTQEEIENNAFAQNKFEAVGLQIKQTKGTITPIEQERLGVLQAKMDDLLVQRQERASRFGHHLANISLHSPDRPVSAPIEPKLPFGLSRISDTQQSVQKSSDTSSNGRRSLVQRIPTAQNLFGSPIQAKLMIGQPGDKYEQEADRVAQQVVQQLNAPKVGRSNSDPSLQRVEIPEEDELQMKPMAMRFHDGAIDASADLEEGISRARGSGQPLNSGLQQSMGQAFGADFSGVRIHADAQSDQLNRSIQARAFTTGQDVFFRQGAYQPGSRGGQELIAHELTHVMQQKGIELNRNQAMSINSNTSSILPQKSSIQAIQRDQYSADNYTPEENNSVSYLFFKHHTTQGKLFNDETAISNHGQRSEDKPNTLTNMDRADAQREIKRYLKDLSKEESKDLVNQNQIYFTTRGYYKGIETEWNNGLPRVTRTFTPTRLQLGMVWKQDYYQIHHFEGTI
jgi:Domain of unknown function (DUF4157)